MQKKTSFAYPGSIKTGRSTIYFGNKRVRWVPLIFNMSTEEQYLTTYVWQINVMNITGMDITNKDVLVKDLGGVNPYGVSLPFQWMSVLAVWDRDEKTRDQIFIDESNMSGEIGQFNFATFGNMLERNGVDPTNFKQLDADTYESYSPFLPYHKTIAILSGLIPDDDVDEKFHEEPPGNHVVRIPKLSFVYLAFQGTTNLVYPDEFALTNGNGGGAYPSECWRDNSNDVALVSSLISYFQTDNIVDGVVLDFGGDPETAVQIMHYLQNLPHGMRPKTETTPVVVSG